MGFIVTPFFMLGFMLNTLASNLSALIPSKAEQANLLRNVEEVFRTVKVIVSDEGGATDAAVISDVEKTVERAAEYLSLVYELALTKLACTNTEKLTSDKGSQTEMETLISEGEYSLQQCIENTAYNIYNNSEVVTTITENVMDQGQIVLDTLNQCSKKNALQQISCYKKVMATDVLPLKLNLVNALKTHKSGHLEAISIRQSATDCIDKVLYVYRNKINELLEDMLQSS